MVIIIIGLYLLVGFFCGASMVKKGKKKYTGIRQDVEWYGKLRDKAETYEEKDTYRRKILDAHTEGYDKYNELLRFVSEETLFTIIHMAMVVFWLPFYAYSSYEKLIDKK